MKKNFKKAAKAILAAQKQIEESWNGKSYEKTESECYQEQYTKANLDKDLIALLNFGELWWNDIQDWAKNILTTD